MSSISSYDVIVAGVGSMGAPACYYLSKQGYKVLGIEQFDIAHEHGSHAGQSRIIRKAYFEHPDYVPLLAHAYNNWNALEQETGEKLYYETGLVYFGDPSGSMLKGVQRSANQYAIPVEAMDRAAAASRFPSFTIPSHFQALFEPAAGLVTPENAIRLYTRQAINNSAVIHTGEKVMSWKKEGNSISVTTGRNNYYCSKLIIAAGAWCRHLIPAMEKTICVTRQFVAWVKPKKAAGLSLFEFPCWLLADDERQGCYYGFPVLPQNKFGNPHGLKLAHHLPGTITDPDKVNRQTTPEDVENIMYALNKYLPGVFDSFAATKTCLYSNTPDENFIIDKMPGLEENVVMACGFSGHGFKFASAVGEILADLAIVGKTQSPIGFLSANRFLKEE